MFRTIFVHISFFVLVLFPGSCTELKNGKTEPEMADDADVQNNNLYPGNSGNPGNGGNADFVTGNSNTEDNISTGSSGAGVQDAGFSVSDSQKTDTEKKQIETGFDAQTNTCTPEGSVRCVVESGVERDRCENGIWVATDPCDDQQVCDVTNTSEYGTCIDTVELCPDSTKGNICDAEVMFKCDENGVFVSQEKCSSERHCTLGIPNGTCATCLPDTFQCEGVSLKKCADDGSEYAPFDTCDKDELCDDSAGACIDSGKACAKDSWKCEADILYQCDESQTAYKRIRECGIGLCDAEGKECDICKKGEKHCKVGEEVILACDENGQGYEETSCSGDNPYCAEEGVCVACLEDNDCEHLDESCTYGICENNECKEQSIAEGEPCNGSNDKVCDDSGSCVDCTADEHCTIPGEACDLRSYECKKAYTPCYSSSDCRGGGECNTSGYCSAACNTMSDCGGVWPSVCYLNECWLQCLYSEKRCPPGFSCNTVYLGTMRWDMCE